MARPTWTRSLWVFFSWAPCAALGAARFFGFYDDDIHVTGAFTNLHQASNLSDAIQAAGLGQQSLLNVRSTFFTDQMRLRSDSDARWKALVIQAKELLSNKTLLGFNLGDELRWNCMSQSTLETAANAVRATFPRGQAIIWYNEASGPASRQKDHCGNSCADFKIPDALDWFSVDIYHMDGYVANWVKDNVQAFYNEHIFPNLTKQQQVMLVPGSFGSTVNQYPNGTYVCNQTCYDDMCARDAVDFYTWASTDDRVAAVMPWNWGGCATCNGSRWTPPHTCCMDEIGTKDQPQSRKAWSELGRLIIRPSPGAVTV